MLSQRALSHQPSRSLRYEFEDLVRTMDAAELIASDRREPRTWIARRARSVSNGFAPAASALLEGERPAVQDRYDLLFVAIESLRDLQRVRQLSWLLRRARTSVCLVDEVWRKGLAQRTGELRLLRQFEHVLVGTAGAVDAIATLTGRPARYLPPSVDTLSLCPYPEDLVRPIDVYSMGRRSAATHAAMLELAGRKRWFYLYDTLTGAGTPDHRQHRRHLGDILKRTRYFLAYPGKMDAPEETGGQQELGYRYFEGAAAGAVLVGEGPGTPWFGNLFGWRDAIILLPYGAADPSALQAALDLDPERERATRRRNVVESLLRHDHVYRWAEVLRTVGLAETPGMELRRRQLQSLAGAVGQDSPPDALRGGAAL
jgi:hypothetical protein